MTAAQAAAGVAEVSLLNFAVSDGATLIATRWVSHEGEEPASLYYAEGSAFQARPPPASILMPNETLNPGQRLCAPESLFRVVRVWRTAPGLPELSSHCALPTFLLWCTSCQMDIRCSKSKRDKRSCRRQLGPYLGFRAPNTVP